MIQHTPNISRRRFLQHGAVGAIAVAGFSFPFTQPSSPMKKIEIARVDANFEREPLARPFGFKGSAITNIWQTGAFLESRGGRHAVGLGVQSVLWSDSSVFAAHTESGGNALMYAMSERALQLLRGQYYTDPISLLDEVLPEVYTYGQKITGKAALRKTFALNALVGFDNAAWLLYAAENGYDHFDAMLPAAYRPGLAARHDKVAAIPALGYGTPMDELRRLADDGYFIMKIKIGAPGDPDAMLEKDKAFLKAIHETIGHYETPHTPDGKIPYYFDANGRYDSIDRLQRFLDYAEKIGALEQIAVLEEPFGERHQEDVRALTARGPRVAADESAHTDVETRTRIEQGYNAIAVKAVAKTLSMTLKIAQTAYERDVPCFCADLTVNPILVEWNKCVAARLPAFPGLDFGLQETNGWQNYRDWERLRSYHPRPDAPWATARDGIYRTGSAFFRDSGGIFLPSPHYEGWFS